MEGTIRRPVIVNGYLAMGVECETNIIGELLTELGVRGWEAIGFVHQNMCHGKVCLWRQQHFRRHRPPLGGRTAKAVKCSGT